MTANLFFASLLLLFASCEKEKEHKTSQHLSNQLYLFKETMPTRACDSEKLADNQFELNGAMYLTDKGNLIYHTINQKEDTQSFYFGKYTLNDSAVNYILSDEYYYSGKWDSSWIGDDPEFLKGKTRKINLVKGTLYRSEFDSLGYFLTYTEAEKIIARKRYVCLQPNGIEFFRYHEPENMKFYTWLFKQIPTLAEL